MTSKKKETLDTKVDAKKKYISKQSVTKREIEVILIKESSVIIKEKSGVNVEVSKGDLPKNISIGDEIKI